VTAANTVRSIAPRVWRILASNLIILQQLPYKQPKCGSKFRISNNCENAAYDPRDISECLVDHSKHHAANTWRRGNTSVIVAISILRTSSGNPYLQHHNQTSAGGLPFVAPKINRLTTVVLTSSWPWPYPCDCSQPI